MALNRDDILKIDDKRRKIINVPQWGGDVIIQTLSAIDQIEFEQSINDKVNKNDHVFVLIKNCCVDDNGNKLFMSIDEVKKLSVEPLLSIFNECLSLTVVTEKDIEKKAKNS